MDRMTLVREVMNLMLSLGFVSRTVGNDGRERRTVQEVSQQAQSQHGKHTEGGGGTVKIGTAIALDTLVSSIKRFDSQAPPEMQLNEAKIVRESAAVLANAEEDDLVTVLTEFRKKTAGSG